MLIKKALLMGTTLQQFVSLRVLDKDAIILKKISCLP